MSERTREEVQRLRDAFEQGARAAMGHCYTFGSREGLEIGQLAERAYPLPTRRKVVRSLEGTDWRRNADNTGYEQAVELEDERRMVRLQQ